MDYLPHTMGKQVIFLKEVDSTNEESQRQGIQGAPEGTVCLAEHQTGGKGRLGRRWVSLPGEGIWMSILLHPGITPYEVSQITLLAGLAVCRAIRSVTGCDALTNGLMILLSTEKTGRDLDRAGGRSGSY